MEHFPTYHPILIPEIRPAAKAHEHWDKAKKMFREGKHRDSILSLCHYLSATSAAGGDGNELLLKHGSAKIFINLTKDRFSVRSPFIQIPDGGKGIALLRKLVEMSWHPLNLVRLKLKEGNKVHFEYEDHLSHSHPDKIIAILREICGNADHYDDLFCEQFGAKSIDPIQVSPPTPELLDRAFEMFQAILKESVEHSTYCRQRSWGRSEWSCLFSGLRRLQAMIRPQGYIRSLWIVAYSNLVSNQQDWETCAKNARRDIETMLKVEKSTFAKSLYEASFLIIDKSGIDAATYLKEARGERTLYAAITSLRNERDFHNAAIAQYEQIQYLQAEYYLPPDILQKFEKAQQDASQKPWNEASDILWKATEEAALLAKSADKNEGDTASQEDQMAAYYKMAMEMAKKATRS